MVGLDRDHFEVVFASTTFGAGPCQRYVIPARAGGYPFLGGSEFFVIDPAADQAQVFFKGFAHRRSQMRVSGPMYRVACVAQWKFSGTV